MQGSYRKLAIFAVVSAGTLALIVIIMAKKVPSFEIEDIIYDKTIKSHVAAVVSSNKMATEAGFEVLEKGGTAADAAVAVASTLSVAEPWFSSALGGGTWALYYEAETGEITSLDGVGPIGSKASISDYSLRAGEAGIHQSNVPGSWDGWMMWLDRYGTLDLDEVLSPAIAIARNGYPVSSQMAFWLDRLSGNILSRPDSAAIYAPHGRLLREGEMVFQQDLANTFEDLIAAYNGSIGEGRSKGIQAARDYYYRGPLAQAIVEFSDQHNGYLTLADFNNFEAEIVKPISIDYNDEIEVFQNPPNSQGITMLLILNVLKDYDFSNLSFGDAVHLQAEAVKLAFADRHYHIGDPLYSEIPLDRLLSDGHAANQRQRIDMQEAATWPIPDILEVPRDNHTTTFHITDQYGNAAAVTTSLGAEFLVVGETGIHMNNRMRMVSLKERSSNLLAPGYKVRHTSNPYMALRNGRPYILGGNTGVDTQPQAQAQQFLHIVEFGRSAQEAVDHPRFVSTAFPAGSYPYSVGNTLQLEQGFSPEVVSDLRGRGHAVTVGPGIFGVANMLVINSDGNDADIGAESRIDTAFGRKKAGR